MNYGFMITYEASGIKGYRHDCELVNLILKQEITIVNIFSKL